MEVKNKYPKIEVNKLNRLLPSATLFFAGEPPMEPINSLTVAPSSAHKTIAIAVSIGIIWA